jgi:hypothetical protein
MIPPDATFIKRLEDLRLKCLQEFRTEHGKSVGASANGGGGVGGVGGGGGGVGGDGVIQHKKACKFGGAWTFLK